MGATWIHLLYVIAYYTDGQLMGFSWIVFSGSTEERPESASADGDCARLIAGCCPSRSFYLLTRDRDEDELHLLLFLLLLLLLLPFIPSVPSSNASVCNIRLFGQQGEKVDDASLTFIGPNLSLSS